MFLLNIGWSYYIGNPHQFTNLCLESNILSTIINSIWIRVREDFKRLIINYIANLVLSKFNNYRICSMLQTIIAKFNKIYTFYIKTTDLFLSIIVFIVKNKYPLVYNICLVLQYEYICIIKGYISFSHIQLFIALGLLVGREDYFCYLLIMVLASRVKTYMYIRGLDILYPNIYRTMNYLLYTIYSVCLAICTGHTVNFIILPLIKKLIIFIKTVFNGILSMSGNNESNLGIGESNMDNPTPEPQKPTPESDKTSHIGSLKKGKKVKKVKNRDYLDDTKIFRANYDNLFDTIKIIEEQETKDSYNLPKIMKEYNDYLP